MSKKVNIIDPLEIEEGFPYIVLASHSTNLISWAIRWRTKGSYNHGMWLFKKGTVASQDMTYAEKPIKKYMKKGFKLKIIKIKNPKKEVIIERIERRLKLPWWKTLYDFMGILGQAIGIKKLNNPYKDYCIESLIKDLLLIIKGIPIQSSPEDINVLTSKDTDNFEYVGHYLAD